MVDEEQAKRIEKLEGELGALISPNLKRVGHHLEQLAKNVENCNEDTVRIIYNATTNLERFYYESKNFDRYMTHKMRLQELILEFKNKCKCGSK